MVNTIYVAIAALLVILGYRLIDWALPKGWVCTVAGTPGTWVSLGNL
jgi:hypothetical protein